MGYSRAGFEVVGVDIKPQHYPFEFHQADALGTLRALTDGSHACPPWLWQPFDAIHASPPCQAYTPLRDMWNAKEHVDLVAPTRELLDATGLPYVIENVPGAPLHSPVILCGTQFRLGIDGAELRRHRLFESNADLFAMLPPCQHGWSSRPVGVYGNQGNISRGKRVIGVYGGHGRDRRRRVNCQGFTTEQRREAMGIDWMTGSELSQAIPPAYTEWIGERLLNAIKAAA